MGSRLSELRHQIPLFDDVPVLPAVDPAHVTFRGGASEPGHAWYPYLEGYSPEFVRFVFGTYMPHARRVLDPFAGTGTTLLTLGASGILTAYSEVNPVLRALIDLKATVAHLPAGKRRALTASVLDLANRLPSLVEGAEPAADLQASYDTCFGSSQFFHDEVFETVLRLRAVNDAVSREDPLLGLVLSVAATSQLIPCSLLKRAGDLRFRTAAELSKGVEPLIPAVRRQLRRVASDVASFPSIGTYPKLLCTNAKDLIDADAFGADGVVTSPPYLNGTNYIRNTKLELWYRRDIKQRDDLRNYRDAVVTAGINDVRSGSIRPPMHPRVAAIVEELERLAYDLRIPQMVASYFADMRRVLDGLAHHVIPGGVVCIDIGDSRYGGVHVPTQDLLIAVAMDVGFRIREVVRLRSRTSKDGSRLSQDLLVFENAGSTTAGPIALSLNGWRTKWEAFKEQLPHRRYPFSKRNWGHPLHSLCSYSGKMKPALAHHLIECFTEPGDAVLDPFSGSGTIPFEAALAGRRAVAFDLARLPVVITNAKLRAAERTRTEALLERLDKWLMAYTPAPEEFEEAAEIRFNRPIPEYFHPMTLKEVLAARQFFLRHGDDSAEWDLVYASLLHILHGNRPYALSRRSHPLTPYAPSGPVTYRSLMAKLREKVERCLSATYPETFVLGVCHQVDALGDWPVEVTNLSAIITSPPFYDSTRFYMANWMRYWFAGWSKADFLTKPREFVETKQQESFAVYTGLLERAHERMRPGALVVFHLGFSRKCDMAAEICSVLPSGFEVLEVFNETVGHCESHGVRDKGTVTEHQYLLLRRT